MSEEYMREKIEAAITKNCSSFTINKEAIVNEIIKIVKKHEEVIHNCERVGFRLPLMIRDVPTKKKK